MKSTRFLLVAALVFVAASCTDRSPMGVTADQPTSVAATKATTGQQNDLLGGLLQSIGLLRCSPLAPATTTATIGPWGGSLKVGPHTFTVPAGALSQNVTITASLSADTVNAITFKPEGLQFAKPASLTLSYANSNLIGILLPKQIAYTNDNYGILSLLLSVDNLLARRVTGQVWHFSHYAVAW